MSVIDTFNERRTEQTLGELTSQLFELKERKAALEAKKREVNKMIDDIEFMIIQKMDENGLDRLSVDEGTVSKKVELYPRVEDKDAFINWALNNGYAGMITAQVNRAVFKEYYEEYNEYPEGVDAFEKPKLNTRRSR